MKNFKIPFLTEMLLLVVIISISIQCQEDSINGPLRVSDKNPRYFTDNSGKAVYLTGSHTWNNLVDMEATGSDEKFDFEGYLKWMKQNNHNFIRLWTWELLNWDTQGNREKEPKRHIVAPHPWLRSGLGTAPDGQPKFDLTQFDPEYFSRLEERVKMAEASGIYVSVMLFEGWGVQFSPGAFENHPFHPQNNINGINGDLNGDSTVIEIHTLSDGKILSLQEKYVSHVIDVINNYDNVLYEISNENHPPSTEWQYHMINFIKEYERKLPKQHPVGMTFQYRGGTNKALFDSPADWISPNPEGGFRDNPPPADGSKVILTDTDHLWGIGGNTAWVWKSFFRGLNPIFMDPYYCRVLSRSCDTAWMDSMRRSMGNSRILADRINLISMTPNPEITSSGYCLENPGSEYLVFLADTTVVTIDLVNATGKFRTEWFDTVTGQFSEAKDIGGGEMVTISSPSGLKNAVLHLH